MLVAVGNQKPDLISGNLPKVIQCNVLLELANLNKDLLKVCIVIDVPPHCGQYWLLKAVLTLLTLLWQVVLDGASLKCAGNQNLPSSMLH